jgi:hypothetical protein
MSGIGDQSIDKKDKLRQYRSRQRETVDWESVDAHVIRRAVALASLGGGALRLGYSRDGGVFAIGVLGDGEPYTLWCKNVAECEAELRDLSAYYVDNPKPTEQPHKPKKRA